MDKLPNSYLLISGTSFLLFIGHLTTFIFMSVNYLNQTSVIKTAQGSYIELLQIVSQEEMIKSTSILCLVAALSALSVSIIAYMISKQFKLMHLICHIMIICQIIFATFSLIVIERALMNEEAVYNAMIKILNVFVRSDNITSLIYTLMALSVLSLISGILQWQLLNREKY